MQQRMIVDKAKALKEFGLEFQATATGRLLVELGIKGGA
jgi:hypothetical protein